ncbi:MAG: M23 family metallopeptidase [Spirochaetaceae bacterium]|jgi:hypothetical protein|nr:M23 family metallopeptidase [Spirochaetaceae bacterium]
MWEKIQQSLRSTCPGGSAVLLGALLLAGTLAAAFDWPEQDVRPEAFAAPFAGMRGGLMSPSLVFSAPALVTAAGKGAIVAVIRAPDSDSPRFYSALGNAVVVNHSDGFISTYGNLATISVYPDTVYVDPLMPLGFSGASGWSEGGSGLEFQTADIRQRTAINPRTLLPRFQAELPLELPPVLAVNKQEESFPLQSTRRLAAGQYRFYLSGQAGNPYITTLTVNGVHVETIVSDTLNVRNNTLAIRGNRYYGASEFYPSEGRRLLAEVNLSRGRNTVNVVIRDINNREKQVTFSLDVY